MEPGNALVDAIKPSDVCFWPKADIVSPSTGWFRQVRCILLSLGGGNEAKREFIGLLGGAAPRVACSAHGQKSKVARIGVLYIGTADERVAQDKSSGRSLRERSAMCGRPERGISSFGQREGKLERLPGLAAELVPT